MSDAYFHSKVLEGHRRRNDSHIADCFEGFFKSTVVCPSCSKVSVSFDPYMSVAVPLVAPGEVSTRAMNVTLRRIDGSLEKLYLQMNHGASVAEMRRAVAELTALPADRLAVVELYNNRVHKLFACTEDEKIDACYENDLIFLYEVHHPHFGRAAAAARARAAATAAAAAAAAAASPAPATGVGGAAAAEESRTSETHRTSRRKLRRKSRRSLVGLGGVGRVAGDGRRRGGRRGGGGRRRRRRGGGRRGGGCGRAAAVGVRVPTAQGEDVDLLLLELLNLVGLPFCITVPADVSASCCTPPWARSSSSTIPPSPPPPPPPPPTAPRRWRRRAAWRWASSSASTRRRRRRSAAHRDGPVVGAYAGASEGASEGDAASGDAVEPAWKLHHPMSGYGGGEQTGELIEPTAAGRVFAAAAAAPAAATSSWSSSWYSSPSTNRTAAAPADEKPRTLVVEWGAAAFEEGAGGHGFSKERLDAEAPAQSGVACGKMAASAGGGVTLRHCFDLFSTEEKLDEENMWYCPRCKEHRQATKKIELWSIPDVLVVHLKRFSQTGLRQRKRETAVHFPLEGLDLTADCLGLPHQAAAARDAGAAAPLPPLYDCVAVSNHYGSTGGGHYTAFARDGAAADAKWHKYDDSHTAEVAPTRSSPPPRTCWSTSGAAPPTCRRPSLRR